MHEFERVVRQLIQRANSGALELMFNRSAYAHDFYVEGKHVGFIRRDLWNQMESVTQGLFTLTSSPTSTASPVVELSKEADSEKLHSLLLAWKSQTLFPACTNNWRNEIYGIQELSTTTTRLSHPPLTIERACAPLFGIRSFGCHLNCYTTTITTSGSPVASRWPIRMWIAMRSASKQTYPSMLDNTVGGGLPLSLQPDENIWKEAGEEAGVPLEMAVNARPAGLVSFILDSRERGVIVETDFVYDLEVSSEFVPRPVDGEVERFFLWSVEEVVEHLMEFTPESGLIAAHFILRHCPDILTDAQIRQDLQRNLEHGLRYE